MDKVANYNNLINKIIEKTNAGVECVWLTRDKCFVVFDFDGFNYTGFQNMLEQLSGLGYSFDYEFGFYDYETGEPYILNDLYKKEKEFYEGTLTMFGGIMGHDIFAKLIPIKK